VSERGFTKGLSEKGGLVEMIELSLKINKPIKNPQ
jgi:hypothetical protein